SRSARRSPSARKARPLPRLPVAAGRAPRCGARPTRRSRCGVKALSPSSAEHKPQPAAARGPRPAREPWTRRPANRILRPTSLVYHLTVEARRPPSWLSAVPRDQHMNRLRSHLGGLAASAKLHWLDASTLVVLLRYMADRRHARDRHQDALDAVCR